ncbi:SDR family NAD(P)-dependent oxidoreductase [Novosphingobium endophyticum]|uniref:SDR family NAD(P)-dependent oxidoreductase n=1 Tax=Novosphingobium endophyticum TaxID=1955250 RepID=UPI001E4B3F69|nr:3-oxoacyl-ACP reductase family protein [Novosphingobium endophyticum]
MTKTLQIYGLDGRVALVTGGSDGIGRAIAQLLAERGADVAIAARRAERLEQAATDIGETSGRRTLAVTGDVTDPDQAASLVERTVKEFGRLDILVNNAGAAHYAFLRKATPEQWRRDLDLNLSSAFFCSQAAYPHLSESRGVIVNISSLAGQHGTLGTGGYSAAKAGLQMLTRTAAAEWGPRGIRVNAVAAGMTETRKAKLSWEKMGFDVESACKAFPLRRPGTPEEVAQAVAFLASDAAAYITGETLTVGGGPQLKGMIDTD